MLLFFIELVITDEVVLITGYINDDIINFQPVMCYLLLSSGSRTYPCYL